MPASNKVQSAPELAAQRSNQYRRGEQSGRTWVAEQGPAAEAAVARLSELYDDLGVNARFWFCDDDTLGFTTAERVFFVVAPEYVGKRKARAESRYFWEDATMELYPTPWFVEGFVVGALAAREKAVLGEVNVAANSDVQNEVKDREQEHEDGRQCGRMWVTRSEHAATAEEVARLGEMYVSLGYDFGRVFDDNASGRPATETVYYVIAPEHEDDTDEVQSFWEDVARPASIRDLSNVFVGGFVEGALKAWDERKARV